MQNDIITKNRVAKPIPVIYWREIKNLNELKSRVEERSVVFEEGKLYLKELINDR